MTAAPEQSLFQHHHRHIPVIDLASWFLIIDGHVANTLTLNYSNLMAMPAMQSQPVMLCKGHSDDCPRLAEVTWGGVPLAQLLDRVGPNDRATHANIHSADGYVTALPLPELDNALLALTLNGAPLPPEHGYPLRLVVPGKLGYKLPKWITHIIITDTPALGHWERRGSDTDGSARPLISADESHRRGIAGAGLTLSGIAYGGPQPVTAIEASVDGGPWAPVTHFGGQAGRLAHWQIAWQPALPGRYAMQLRVTAGDGQATTPVMIEVT
jgi:DMSO/TMAO reductase YedYZ molybdopterin-dependent catalytic subunit